MKKKIICFLLVFGAVMLFACNKKPGESIIENNEFVIFDTLGGSHIDNLDFVENMELNAPIIPRKDGHIFEGWYKNELYEEVFDFENEIITEPTTLYAKWRKNTTDFNDTFKVLSIGNSFSEDAHWLLWSVANSYGINPENIVVANMYIGGAPLDTHRIYMLNDQDVYRYEKYTGPVRKVTNNYRLSDAIKDEEWDVITFQEGSTQSGLFEQIGDTITLLSKWAKEEALNPNVQVAWHMTWAYQQNSTHAGFANYNNNQITMFNMINEVLVKKVFSNNLVNFVIPSGVAVQNARTSYLGDTLTLDGYHLSIPHGRYIASLSFFKAITNFDITMENIEFAPTGVTQSDKMVIFEAVNNAFKNEFTITNSIFPE